MGDKDFGNILAVAILTWIAFLALASLKTIMAG